MLAESFRLASAFSGRRDIAGGGRPEAENYRRWPANLPILLLVFVFLTSSSARLGVWTTAKGVGGSGQETTGHLFSR